jgi:HTH-type transcriptional repressor of NAD biosynthesis genes
MIRENPYACWDYLPNCVRKYYTKKVCVIGTESTGKTTLVRKLAKELNTSHVEEAGRYICDDAGGIDNMQKYHYFEILFKHKQLEKEALTNARKVMLIDTDSLITLYYYNLGFKDNDPLNQAFSDVAQGISVLNNYDLYLFLEPDVEWVQDGTRTYGEQGVREDNNLTLKELLKKNGIEYVTIRGNYQERYEQSKNKVLELIGGV